MTNGNQEEVTPEQRQAWLIEYQVCQSHNNSLTTEFWAVATIMLTINVALLAGLFYSITTSLFGINDTQRAFITAVAIVMSMTSGYFAFWLKRLQFIERVHFVRMREIENILSLEKSWLFVGLDKTYGKATEDPPERLGPKLEQLKKTFPKRHFLAPTRFFNRYESPMGGWLVFCTLISVIPLWIFFVLLAWSVPWYFAWPIFLPVFIYIYVLYKKRYTDKEQA
jgi:hypothetical protein